MVESKLTPTADVPAPGPPGIPARWTSSAKQGVGTALNRRSRVWFTHSHGILNEIYYPEVDQVCTRDLGLLVTDGRDFFSEEKRDTHTRVDFLSPGIPAYHLVNTCAHGKYRIEKDVITDPAHDALVQRTRFVPLEGSLEDYHVYVLLAPHLGNHGGGNNAWVGSYSGRPMLFAERNGIHLALAFSTPPAKMSVGYVGASDGWQDVKRNKQMTWEYTRAENGNVALIAEIDIRNANGLFVLSVGFGGDAAAAAAEADAGVSADFDTLLSAYIDEWRAWQRRLTFAPQETGEERDMYMRSVSVLQTSESKRHRGGIIASLSIPWGFARGDDDLGGYHLVWTRDLVEAAGALLAAGANDDVLRVLDYLASTQLPDGHWSQNMWISGAPYWSGIQMDETAFPILLIDLAYRRGILNRESLKRYWKTVRTAAAYLAMNGPVTQEDRWEEDPGYSPFTLAVEIAGLLAAADIAELHDERALASCLRECADAWNSNIERWTYVTGTELSRKFGVDGYYVRIAPPDAGQAASPQEGYVPIKNRPPGQSTEPAVNIISPDVLALVRFGLRSPDDPRILNTLKIIDGLLSVDTPTGRAWHRYNDDGYGEHEDGSPFDGTGTGRAWPLLVGERAHYELAGNRPAEASALLSTMRSFANEGGMIPEQIWDSPDIPDRELYFGRPSGSAMPLVWAHAEYVKLVRSLHDGRVFDTPPQTMQRYISHRTESLYALWRFNHKCRVIPAGKVLRIEVLAPALAHWSVDDWRTIHDTETHKNEVGFHVVELPTRMLPGGAVIRFTFLWSDAQRWEGQDFAVQIER